MTGDSEATRIEPLSPPRFGIGLLCLAVSAAASSVLVAKHLHLFTPPGCGDGSPCDRAAESLFGSVPVLGWPTSFVGMAYFLALAVAWIVAWRAGRPVPAAFRNLVRLGAALSVVFLVVMVSGGYACPYCILVHVGNFGFLAVLETMPRGVAASSGARRLAGWGLGAFAIVTVLQLGLGAYAESLSRGDLEASKQQIIDASRRPADQPEIEPAVEPGDEQADETAGKPFTGRYRLGPERAPIRIVIISDYQCPDCREVEGQVREILNSRSDVSFSAKHHPFCTQCNDRVSKDLHPNACWAARAAEAAGILHGNDGFWKMHFWLFDRGGSFTEPVLNAQLAAWGWDTLEFKRVMTGDETLDLVKQDIAEARSLGLYATPMIFINGVELRGWTVPNAIIEAVEALAATNPPPGDASQDHPPAAKEKYIGDWRAQPAINMPDDDREWILGPPDAAVQIVVWGDYQEPYTAQADIKLRDLVISNGDASYVFRHYPINPDCNPLTQAPFTHELACGAAAAAEAAGTLGGNDAFWQMHDWLMNNQDTFTDATLAEQARVMGFHPEELFAAMKSPEIAKRIAYDSAQAQRLGLRAIPFIFINGKFLQRWNKEGVVEAIFEEAGGRG